MSTPAHGKAAAVTGQRGQAADGPGVVRVRLSGLPGGPETVAVLLADVPGVEVLTGPDGPYPNRRQPGHRLYLTVRLTPPDTPNRRNERNPR